MVQYNDGKVQKQRRAKKGKKVALPPKTARAVSRMIDAKLEKKPENKHVGGSTSGGLQPIGGTPFLQDCATMVQGSTENNRIGNHIQPTFLGCRYVIQGTDGAQKMTRVRILAIQYKPNTASTGDPNWGQIVQATNFPFTYRQTDYTKQFRILYDAKHVIVNDTASEAYTVYGEISVPKLSQISFNDNNSTGENKVYIIGLSDYNDADLKNPTIKYDWRMYYSDM